MSLSSIHPFWTPLPFLGLLALGMILMMLIWGQLGHWSELQHWSDPYYPSYHPVIPYYVS